ncbi:hypothetical protein JW930_04145 [Candidatus Woesearchaeota archaeon]|nr:hypothetical protein [Candidatus Woesearchaeota archaeon]
MTYYCSSCSNGCRYDVSLPSIRYSAGPNTASYDIMVSAIPAAYSASGDATIGYYGSPSVNIHNPESVQTAADDGSAIIIVQPEDLQIIPPRDSITPKLEEIPDSEFRRKPELKALLPRNEIENAIENIKRVEQIEIEEEIILRRRIRKREVEFDR